jgi:hypothetical protein
VAAAIEAAGLSYRCYDVPLDLSSASPMIDLAFGHDIGTVVVLHPFGLLRPLYGITLPDETLVIEDACHALRTALNRPTGVDAGHITVYSPRKELGWVEGGVAAGSLAPSIGRVITPAADVALQWQQADLAALAREGERATSFAVNTLTDKLPPVNEGEVLTALPLKSSRRDTTINRLRAQGIMAWRWLRSLRGTGPQRTPEAWALREKLLLVPLCAGTELERTLDLLRSEPLEPWNR